MKHWHNHKYFFLTVNVLLQWKINESNSNSILSHLSFIKKYVFSPSEIPFFNLFFNVLQNIQKVTKNFISEGMLLARDRRVARIDHDQSEFQDRDSELRDDSESESSLSGDSSYRYLLFTATYEIFWILFSRIIKCSFATP